MNFLALVAALFGLSSPAFADATDPARAEAIFKQMLDTYASLKSYSDNGVAKNSMDTVIYDNGEVHDWGNKFEIQMERPAIYKLLWHSGFENMPGGVVWSKGKEIYYKAFDVQGNDFKWPDGTIVKRAEHPSRGFEFFGEVHHQDLVPLLFFGLETRVQEECSLFVLGPDDSVEGVACYVLNGQINDKMNTTSDSEVTLWVGKEDHLIHKYTYIHQGITTIQVHTNIVVNHDINITTFPTP
jgi:outer membrane lipoprotein-sorting protein